jgi:hypothetical protein
MSTGKRAAAARGTERAFPLREWPFMWAAAGAVILTTLVAILCAKPVIDSDLWYHMAYGRQILETGSLRLDHTAFSWTPSDNAVIYCAWIAQLLFLTLHDLAGLTGLFVLRYVVVAGAFGRCCGWHIGAARSRTRWCGSPPCCAC